jgi:hypothetical protein
MHPLQDTCHGWGKRIAKRCVPATTVDCQATSLESFPDFIKCDVEGHELEVFKGALLTLETAKPKLFIEVHWLELGVQLISLLNRFYKDLEMVRHPDYQASDWGYANHYWLIAN